jgi:hypothetical protein
MKGGDTRKVWSGTGGGWFLQSVSAGIKTKRRKKMAAIDFIIGWKSYEDRQILLTNRQIEQEYPQVKSLAAFHNGQLDCSHGDTWRKRRVDPETGHPLLWVDLLD